MRKSRLTFTPLALATLLALSGGSSAYAQSPTTVNISIIAQPLGQALNELARQANLQLSFPASEVAGKTSPAVSGNLTPRQALDRVLAGSGLEATVNGSTVTVRPAPKAEVSTLPAVTVTAETAEDASPLHLRKKMSSGALGTQSQLDTPFSTTIVTSEEIEERQVNTVADAFGRDPAVTNQNAAYTIWGTQLTVRGLGLSTDNGYKINGLPAYAMGLDIPYEQLESIQLLKGLSGFMYGFGAPGGIANFVTKKPAPDAVHSVEVGYRSNSIWTEHVDLANSFTANDRFGYRINATHEEGNTYNDGTVRRNSVSLGLAAHLTPDLTWSLDVLHQERHTTGEISALDTDEYTGPVLPKAVSANDARLATRGTYNDTNLTFASTGLDYQINPDWKFTGKFGYTSLTTTYVKDFNYLENYRGDYDIYLLGDRYEMPSTIWQGLLQGNARTGSFEHQLVFGVERQKLNYDADTNGIYDYFGTGNIYLNNPVVYSGDTNWDMFRAVQYVQSSAYASDKIGLSDHWSILAGLRYTDYQQTSYKTTGAISSQYRKNGVLTPTLALMYKPTNATTIYGSYVEALESGGIVSSRYANANEMLKPLKSKQYEIGIKTETDTWSTTAALFRMERAASYANSQNVFVQDGLTVFQGLEVAGSVRPMRNLTVGGGLMLLDPVYKHGTAYDGNRVSGQPRVSATAYVKYDVPQVPGLGMYADLKFIGDTYVNAINTLPNGSRALIGLGVSYATRLGGHAFTYRASVSNLTDHKGWTGGGGQIIPLAPRTFALNAKLEF